MACFLERLGGNPSFFRDLAKGETAATEVKRRWNAEGVRNAPIAKSLEKPGLETSECKEARHPVNGYGACLQNRVNHFGPSPWAGFI